MPSSTSPSKPPPVGTVHEGALPAGLRLTASDRPGQAQPVPTRDIPTRAWKPIALVALIIMLIATAGWEVWARSYGLRAGDIGDSPQAWAEMRSSVRPNDVVIVGDSRILFDTDLAWFERLTGVMPRQLAIHGTNGRVLMEHLTQDPTYRGLLIVGLADTSFFRPEGTGVGGPWIEGAKRNREPSQVSGLIIDRFLQRHVALMDSEIRLSRLLPRLDTGWRRKESPYGGVWKIEESFDHRQRFMWGPIERPGYRQGQARGAWNGFEGKPILAPITQKVLGQSRTAARQLRARGGEIVFIRPPSSPELRVNEEQRLPKTRGWDALLASVPADGIHADDLPEAQNLDLPEFSHLSRACARVFTDAYVRRLVELTSRLRLRADAPPPLGTADCKGKFQ